MKISVLCSSKEHPVYAFMEKWQDHQKNGHAVELVQSIAQLSGGDILFLISCSDLIKKAIRDLYKVTLVIHASNLPFGRGWSPHVWQIIEGKNDITVTLLEAEDKVDSGNIWAQRVMHLDGHELYNEINDRLFAIECELMDFAVDNFRAITPRPQSTDESTYYRKRSPEDSRIDPGKTIAEQFDLLRVTDYERYPAFFYHRGKRYMIKIEKVGNDQ